MVDRRLKEIDILRALAFIFVVEQHTMGGYYRIEGISSFYYWFFITVYTFARPAVASFLFISALTMSKAELSNNTKLLDFYVKKAKYILLPYILWSMLYMFIYKTHTTVVDIIYAILSGDAYFHLWYMGMFIRFLIYFPLCFYIFKKINLKKVYNQRICMLLMFVIYYFLSKYQYVISGFIIKLLYTDPTPLQEKFVNVSPLFWSLYFLCGIFVAFNYEKFKMLILKYSRFILVIWLAMLVYETLREGEVIEFNRFVSIAYFMFSILSWFIISEKISNNNKVYLCFSLIGKYSFGAYLCHLFVIGHVMNFFAGRLQIVDWLLLGVLIWILSSVISPCVIKAISWIPGSEFLTGVRTKHRMGKNV